MCRLIIRESNFFVSVFYFVIYLSYIETRSVTPLFHKMFISPHNNVPGFSGNSYKLILIHHFISRTEMCCALSEKKS